MSRRLHLLADLRTGDAPGLPPPTENVMNAFLLQKHGSPTAGRNCPTQLFRGDTRLGIAVSMETGARSVRA